MKRMTAGGGWKAIGYSLKLANRVGWKKMWTGLRSKNACKTCAVGMGGQLGGMVNEGGHFPEVCKKSFQAMASDLQPALPDDFFSKYSIDQLRAMSPARLEASGRLVQPVILRSGATHFQPLEWNEALDRFADGLRSAGPERSFFYVSGRSSNEAGFLTQLLARLMGTNYVNNCSYYCHQASGAGLSSAIGSGAGTVRLEDLDHTDLYILIGANPASNHPRLMRTLMQIRRRGGRVVVINPVVETGLVKFKVPSDVRSLLFGSKIASDYIQPHIGGDMALLIGVAKCVLHNNGHDVDFIQSHTHDFESFRASVEETDWATIESESGVPRSVIEKLAAQYMAAENVVIAWAMGITHHARGTENVQAIANLALLRGMIGRRRAGVMPIRGHSNVQGMGSVGVTPKLKSGILQRFEERLGITPPTSPGYDTMACMRAAMQQEMDVALCLGGNLYGSNPDSRFASEALGRMKQVTYFSTTLNTGHAWGTAAETMILPVLPRDEEPQPTTQESMFSFVRLSEGGAARLAGPRSEVSLLAEIGQRLFAESSVPVNWRDLESHAAVRALIADLIPGYEDIGNIDDTGEEFHVAGRAPENWSFSTDDGKARFHAVALNSTSAPTLAGDSAPTDELRLMTVRSEGQFNTVVYDEEDIYRGQERRDVILMHPDDVERLGLHVDQRVRVKSATGEMRNVLVRSFDVRAGNALMYFPEANILVSTDVDPISKTPAFKWVNVTVSPENADS